jgi:uncharacterized protein (DUF1330 family)
MSKGYWIVRIDVEDLTTYERYRSMNAAPLSAFGGRFLVRGGRFEAPEGSSRSRNIVVEFPSYQAALACYHSPDYQAAAQVRQAAARGELIIIEGHEEG